jgi:hypothetical protein
MSPFIYVRHRCVPQRDGADIFTERNRPPSAPQVTTPAADVLRALPQYGVAWYEN